MDRYCRGKTRKVFDFWSIVGCSPKETQSKHLINAFVGACLNPFDVLSSTQDDKAVLFRPRTVLFTGAKQANYPQVHSFLEFMGCTDLQVAEPALMDLFDMTTSEQTSREHARKNISKEKNPHLYEEAVDRLCAKCGKTDPDAIRRCVCHAAWYCSKTCQTEHWKEHKAEHKNKLAEKEGKT